MSNLSEEKNATKRLVRKTLLWGVIPVVLYSVAWFIDVPLENVSRDAADLYNFHPLIGVLSNLGLILWTASAVVLFFSAYVVRGISAVAEQRASLLRFGLLSSMLLLDDLFLLHEQVVPQNLGVSQKLTYLLYGSVFSILVWRSRNVLLSGNSRMLVAAFMCFALSVGLDLLPNLLPTYHYALEDTPKFIGIALWTTFFWGLGRESIVSAFPHTTPV